MTLAPQLISLAMPRVSRQETRLILEFLDQILHPQGKQFDTARILQMIKSGQYSTAFNSLALYLNNCARKLSLCTSAATRAPLVRSLLHFREKLVLATVEVASEGQVSTPAAPARSERPATIEAAIARVYQLYVGRSPAPEEIEIWKNNFKNGLPFHEFFLAMESGEEAKQHSQRQTVLADVCDGEFVQTAYELIMGRGAAAWEIEGWLTRLERGELKRAEVLAKLFEAANKFFISLANEPRHDGLSCWVMGTGTHVSAADWQGKAKALRDEPAPKSEPDNRYKHRFQIKSEPRVLVSALASMYRGGDFIEQFMDNITSLDGFDDYCELIIVDADSPENEYETIKRYLASHKNINYIRCNYRIGIYDAWNVAAKAARGDYLTNTNLDDLRRHDSFMLQAATLDNLPFVDVVYQDLYYTFDPRLSFDEIVPFGLQSVMPVITPHNLIKFNSPHNAPMWRRKLHEELGYFDTFYKSAGDYEFWMRCLAAGKKFYKINDPHVVYYQNPKGLSTRPDTRGIAESMEIHKAYCRRLIAREVVMPCPEFIQKLAPGGTAGALDNIQDRYVLAQQALRNVARRQKYQMTSRGQE